MKIGDFNKVLGGSANGRDDGGMATEFAQLLRAAAEREDGGAQTTGAPIK